LLVAPFCAAFPILFSLCYFQRILYEDEPFFKYCSDLYYGRTPESKAETASIDLDIKNTELKDLLDTYKRKLCNINRQLSDLAKNGCLSLVDPNPDLVNLKRRRGCITKQINKLTNQVS
jgi:hypothetical protein